MSEVKQMVNGQEESHMPSATLRFSWTHKDTILTTQSLHTNNNSHFSLTRARLSGILVRSSSPSSTTYDRTLDHTSSGSGLTGCGWGNRGSKRKLPGVRASGLGCRNIAGVSVYMPARLMVCVSEKNKTNINKVRKGQQVGFRQDGQKMWGPLSSG